MTEHIAITLHDQTLHLLADRALHWPNQQLLVIADLHLGKGDTFRSHGIAVPSGGTAHDLARLQALLMHTRARKLLILGDVLHGDIAGPGWRAQWEQFRACHPDVTVQAIVGNHDRQLMRAGLTLDLLGDTHLIEGITLRHDPGPIEVPHLCGHLHPVMRLPGLGRRQPVFWRTGNQLVLPAFSAFTGGYLLRPRRGEQYYPCNGESIVAI